MLGDQVLIPGAADGPPGSRAGRSSAIRGHRGPGHRGRTRESQAGPAGRTGRRARSWTRSRAATGLYQVARGTGGPARSWSSKGSAAAGAAASMIDRRREQDLRAGAASGGLAAESRADQAAPARGDLVAASEQVSVRDRASTNGWPRQTLRRPWQRRASALSIGQIVPLPRAAANAALRAGGPGRRCGKTPAQPLRNRACGTVRVAAVQRAGGRRPGWPRPAWTRPGSC